MTEPMITVSLADLRLALAGFGTDDPNEAQDEACNRLWNLPGVTPCATCKHDQRLHRTEDSMQRPCETCGCTSFAWRYPDPSVSFVQEGGRPYGKWIKPGDPDWRDEWDEP